jgi:hypothetical protein
MRIIFILIVLFISFNHNLCAQENAFILSLDYSLNFSAITDEIVSEDAKLSHNAFAKIEYSLSENLSLVSGLGFLNTGTVIESNLGGTLGIEKFTIVSNYNYIIIPIGIKYYFGKFFLAPEIGFGILVHEMEKLTREYSDGSKETEKRKGEFYSGEINQFSIPLILSIGRNFNIKNFDFYLGFKGFYSLTEVVKNVPRNNHYFGLGLLIGAKF